MRDLVLRDSCVTEVLGKQDAGVKALAECSDGVAALVAEQLCEATLRSEYELSQMLFSDGTSLYDLARDALKWPDLRDSALFFLRIAMKAPLMDDVSASVSDEAYGIQVLSPAEGASMALALCVASGAIAVGVCIGETWRVNPLLLQIMRLTSDGSTEDESFHCDHVYGLESAQRIIEKHLAAQQRATPKQSFWAARKRLFPNLHFGLDVEHQLQNLSQAVYVQAVERLAELNLVASEWSVSRAMVPRYRTKVTGESIATMQKYGSFRTFRSADGRNRSFVLHARLHDGHRLHFVEDRSMYILEVGYIGKHLPIVT